MYRSDAVAASVRPADPSSADARAAMDRYVHGDEQAFGALYEALAPRLYRFCVYLGGRNDAADLMQDVFLKIHRARATFVPGGNVVGWSFAIARTSYLDRVRSRQRKREDLVRDSSLEHHAVTADASPEAASSARALGETLERRLASLSETLRSALILVRIEGMSCEEAARVLGTSIAAVKQRVCRASDQLRACLGEPSD